ncbi:hypothetical protein NC652_015717 [Populus alba x Populus x berolinensis]|nr:hypothetical protein NC652_015717 [Populus alba x Populus x berolinensis]
MMRKTCWSWSFSEVYSTEYWDQRLVGLGLSLWSATVMEAVRPNRIHNPLDEEDYTVSEESEDEPEKPPPIPSFP